MLKLILLNFISAMAFAEGGGEHDAHTGIPWDLIIKQIVNFTVVVGILVYLLKSKIGSYFKERSETFEKMLVLARKAKEDAELQRKDVSARLERLQTTAQESVTKARKEAEDLRIKMKSEAEAMARQVREDAAKTAEREVAKAKQELHDEILNQAMSVTRENMKTSVPDSDQKRLQNEFVEKIQVVR